MATNGAPEQPTGRPQGDRIAGSAFNISGKMLMTAGGGGATLLVVIIVVVLFSTGVFSGGGGGASGGGDWLAYVPGDAAAVGVVDNRAFLGGDVPDDFVDYWEDADNGGSEEIYNFVDIDEGDLSIHASALDHNFDETLEILRGDFDFDIIREELEDGRDCKDDDYLGFEMWECTGQQYPAVALFEKDKYVVLAAQRQSDLENLLTHKSRDPEKLADVDDSDVKRLLDQTEGWMEFAFLGDFCPINRCEGFAIALGKSGDSADMPAFYALLFNSSRAATAAEGDSAIDDLLEEWFSLSARFDRPRFGHRRGQSRGRVHSRKRQGGVRGLGKRPFLDAQWRKSSASSSGAGGDGSPGDAGQLPRRMGGDMLRPEQAPRSQPVPVSVPSSPNGAGGQTGGNTGLGPQLGLLV